MVVPVGVNRVVPPRALDPLHPPDALQLVALVVLQLRVVPWPTTEIELGMAEMVMAGG